ncbi:glycosyltransferase family 87 protein [Hyphococcus lacteus]|uniref:Glycosyltransferase family 87 protein n=1 Tax=Hyphococcus lacteus TaxID=3143536 RepID=A0ABV3Z1Z3_9PROT
MDASLTRSPSADIRLTARHAKIGAGVIALSMAAVFVFQLLLSSNYVTPSGTPVGGDFVAFWTAAKAMVAGESAAIYDPTIFHGWLDKVGPPQDQWGLSWQYPPTYFFAIGFLALLPYGLGYAIWTGGSFALFAGAARKSGVSHWPLLFVLISPVAFQAAITGQNGFLTATLLLGATCAPDKRPILAGVCAALLTMKPQLGILLPFAYMAGGHWRALFAASIGSLSLAIGSILIFGISPWIAFFDSIINASASVSSGEMPLFKMPTVYAFFALLGVPKIVAVGVYAVGAIAATTATITTWRTHESQALKMAVVCCGAFFVTPYAYYYELIIVAVPLALLTLSAQQKGWYRFDHILLAGAFLLPMLLPGDARQLGLNYCFILIAFVAFFILRRIKTDGASA